ncbi:PDZ domain-containing protein [Jiangella aurantiaca]|uniref:PDZ domain-containing protein n=1 Tax=Jiangella aurantiaca TaxID=2530373 RepID=A0A4R5AEH2_9ACTN|nr:PDZ domain-containing protein [Jiangella aurantiaca]TDD69706.1 PDZ domain-containing protein [Jiangella aurantiaca]
MPTTDSLPPVDLGVVRAMRAICPIDGRTTPRSTKGRGRTTAGERTLDDGTATHAFVGIVPGRITPQIAAALGLDIDQGVLVTDVVDDGPAARAGLERGDIITAIAGEPVPTIEDFLGHARHEPGFYEAHRVVATGPGSRHERDNDDGWA